MAEWLDTAFYGFDHAILSALHDFALSTGDGFGWFFRLVSIISLGGFGLLIPGFILLLFKRTRKIGAVMFGAVVIGAVITNLAVKPLVARARPFTLDEIRPAYRFDATCQGTVPQAITAFLESDSFEDALRNAISIGGDSDTIGAICGAVAGAYYGVPDDIREKAESFLDPFLTETLHKFEHRFV